MTENIKHGWDRTDPSEWSVKVPRWIARLFGERA